MPTARVLVHVVDALNSLDPNNKDIMSDVLNQIAQSGTNGQFRTPRHIIKMMVELMQPQMEDVICDPAMGSAGFICAAAQYVSEHYATELMKTENKRHYTTTMFTGFDTDQTMLRIGAMNMMLHGVEAPQHHLDGSPFGRQHALRGILPPHGQPALHRQPRQGDRFK